MVCTGALLLGYPIELSINSNVPPSRFSKMALVTDARKKCFCGSLFSEFSDKIG